MLCAFSPCCNNILYAQTLTDLTQKLIPGKSCEIRILRTSKFITYAVSRISNALKPDRPEHERPVTCYRPGMFFRHRRLTELSFPQGTIGRSLYK